MEQYRAIREQDISVIILNAPEELILKQYQSHFKNIGVLGEETITRDKRQALIEYERGKRRDNRDSYIPPVESDFFSWSDVREFMKNNGCEMVAKHAVTELMLVLEDKARDWIKAAISLVNDGEITPEIMQEAIEKSFDSQHNLNESEQSSTDIRADIINGNNNTKRTTNEQLLGKQAENSSGFLTEIAIFWDYENVSVISQGINVPLAEAVLELAKEMGHVRLKRVYANWRTVSNPINQALYSLGFEPIQVAMGKPNSVDLKLTVDCIDAAWTYGELTHFIIITGDKDYIPLINCLRARHKTVIVIGKADQVSDHLILSADKFVSIEALSKEEAEFTGETAYSQTDVVDKNLTENVIDTEESSSKVKSSQIEFSDGIRCLILAIGAARVQEKSTRLEIVDNLMRGVEGFKYTGCSSVCRPDGSTGFASFSKFIAAAAEAGYIKIENVGGFREVFLPEENPAQESEFSQLEDEFIQREHWNLLFEIIAHAFNEEKQFCLSSRIIWKYIRASCDDGSLPYTKRTLATAYNKIALVGALVRQEDGTFVLENDMFLNKDWFIDRIMAYDLESQF